MSNIKYSYFNQIQAARDISSDNFTKGNINFRWNNDGPTRFNPTRSYFRIRCSLTKANGNSLDETDNVAFNMFAMDNLFQQMKMKINNKVISEMNDYVPQISSLKHRIMTSETRFDKLGNDIMLSSPYLSERKKITSSDRNTALTNDIHKFALTTKEDTLLGSNFEAAADTVTSAVVAATRVITLTFVDTNVVAGALLDLRNSSLAVGKYIAVKTVANDNAVIAKITALTALIITASITNSSLLEDVHGLGNVGPVLYDVFNIRLVESSYAKQRGQNTVEFIWKPSLGFFDLDEYLCGEFDLELTPNPSSSIQQYVIESLEVSKTAGTNFNFEIVDMLMYGFTGYTDSQESNTKLYNIMECMCQAQNLTTKSLTNKTFTIPKNTMSLAMALQQGGSGNNTQYSRSKFKLRNNNDLQLSRFYIQYKGIMLPRVIPDPIYSSTIDYTAQNYYEQMIYNNSYYKNDSESLTDWKSRGPFYYYAWPVDDNLSTEVLLATQFSSTNDIDIASDAPQVLLFSFYPHSFTLNISGGKVSSVSVNNM